jgi:hypothetical protein
MVVLHLDGMLKECRIGVDESPEEPGDTSEAEVSDDIIVRAADLVQDKEEDLFW